jgi:hypothetical protein
MPRRVRTTASIRCNAGGFYPTATERRSLTFTDREFLYYDGMYYWNAEMVFWSGRYRTGKIGDDA